MSGMYRDLLEERKNLPLQEVSPYEVHALLGIMTSAQQGALRTDRAIPEAEDRLIASLWKLSNRRPHQLNSDIVPGSEADDDINNISILASSVAYDAAALRALLEAAYPDNTLLVDQAHTKVLTGLLAGHRDLEAGDLLAFNSTHTMERVRGTSGSLKR